MIGLFAWLKADNTRLGERIEKRMDDLRQEIAAQRTETGDLRERVARLEVLQEEKR